MDINVKKEPNNTFRVEVKVEKEKVKQYLDEALKHEAEKVEVKGFRKGSAPLEMAKKYVEKSTLRSHALNHLLPEIYKQIIAENKFAPIIGPRVELKQFEDDQELILEVVIVEKPEIKLNDYKKALKDMWIKKIADDKKKKEEEAKSDNKDKKEEPTKYQENDQINKAILEALLAITEVGIAEIIVQEEVARMMSSLIEQTEKMGITLEEYTKAHQKTVQQMRDEYKKNAEEIIKADFVITEIAQKEGITVEDKEVDEMIKMIPDEQSRAQLANPEQRMYIKAVLIKSKTLEKLAEIAKNEVGGSKKSDKKS